MSDKRAKATSAFALNNYDIYLQRLTSFYIAARYLGTKALKFNMFFITFTCKKAFIYKNFHRLILFGSEKTNTIFLFLFFMTHFLSVYLQAPCSPLEYLRRFCRNLRCTTDRRHCVHHR